MSSVFILLLVSTVGNLGYGSSLSVRTHLAVPRIMQFCAGFSQVPLSTVCGTVCSTLLTGRRGILGYINPDRSATVQASHNLVRCALSAGFLVALQAMIDGVGLGWCFTGSAVLGASCIPLLIVLRAHGWDGRRNVIHARDEKDDLSAARPCKCCEQSVNVAAT